VEIKLTLKIRSRPIAKSLLQNDNALLFLEEAVKNLVSEVIPRYFGLIVGCLAQKRVSRDGKESREKKKVCNDHSHHMAVLFHHI
jgi:hypothetical protein